MSDRTERVGFIRQGDIPIFGGAIRGDLEKWVGSAPHDIVVGSDPPSVERVVVKGDLHLSTLIPLLKGTLFDDIIFRDVVFYHQNYLFDETKSVGWNLNANWVIDSSCGVLHNALSKALRIDQPVLSIHASFGRQQAWEAPLNIHSFILEGVFPGLTLSPVTGLTLTSIGVRLLGIRGFEFDPQPHSTLSFGFNIFGTMQLDIPGSVVPLDLAYTIGAIGGTVNLTAELSGLIWEDALGVRGLLLENTVFVMSFSATSPWNSYAFDVSATFLYMSSRAYLQGSYASGGQFSLTAELDSFGTDDIDNIFVELFSDTLTLPELDVHIGSATLSIASGQGLSISLRDVAVAEHTSTSVAVTMSSTGVSLSGALSSTSIAFGDVKLHHVMLQLSFWSSTGRKNADVMLCGQLSGDFIPVTLTAAVHLYSGHSGIEWAVVAELDAPNKPFALSDVVPELRDSFLDLALENAVLIVASVDDPLVSQSFPGYQVKQGVQFYGVIDGIPALKSLLRQEVTGLVLNAGWSKASGFNIFVHLPAQSTIDLGNGIKTTPITLEIGTNPPELAISAGLKVPMRDSTPLYFNFELAAGMTSASASAQMDGDWNRPFGIDHLTIGPKVMLAIDIIYEEFFDTGIPKSLFVEGGFKIGSVEASLKMSISEDPAQQLLSGKLKNLDISDLVDFAAILVEHDIPKIPDGLLTFEELKLYICPFGVVLDGTSYPAGFSFKADLICLEKRVDIECTIDKVQKLISLIGAVDNFELGPLSVRGVTGPRAKLECYIGLSKQHLIINGAVTLFDLEVQTYINLQFLPDPIFKFHLMLQFATVFMFKLDADLVGSIHDLPGADFSLRAELESDILDYVEKHVIEAIEAAKAAAAQGIKAAQDEVTREKNSWLDSISAAETNLEQKRAAWELHESTTRGTHQPVIDDYEREIARLEGELHNSRQGHSVVVRTAERKLEEAEENWAAGLAAARRNAENARRDEDNKVNAAQRFLDAKEAELTTAFGDAQRDINNAQRRVWSLDNQINDINRDIYNLERAPWYEFWKKGAIAGLGIAVAGLVAAKIVASGVLDAARAVLVGAEYLTKKGAVEAARRFLERAKADRMAAISAAEREERDKLDRSLVNAAMRDLEEARRGSTFDTVQKAENDLEEFIRLRKPPYDESVGIIGGLENCAEFIAYHAAEAGLEVAKGFTEVTADVVDGGLSLAKGLTEDTLSLLEGIVEISGKVLDIHTIILSGSLRGIVGAGGQPLSAVVKGCVVGEQFEINVTFDPTDAVAFIKEIFEQLWDMILRVLRFSTGQSSTTIKNPAVTARSRRSIDDTDLTDVNVGYSGLTAAKSTLLEQEPAVLETLVDESNSASESIISRGVFSDTQMLTSSVVARRTLALMQEEKGVSIFHDVGEI